VPRHETTPRVTPRIQTLSLDPTNPNRPERKQSDISRTRKYQGTPHTPRLCRSSRSPLPRKNQPHGYKTEPAKRQPNTTKSPPPSRSEQGLALDVKIRRPSPIRYLHEPPCPPKHRHLPQNRRLLLRPWLVMLVLRPSIPARNPTRAMAHQTPKLHGVPWLLRCSPRTPSIWGGHLYMLPNRQYQRRRLAPQNKLLRRPGEDRSSKVARRTPN
jgi:hypothetical protein